MVLVSTQFDGQTFTAGLTGGLTEVDLAVGCFTAGGATCASSNPGDVTVEIHSGSPNGALLPGGSVSLSGSAIPIHSSSFPSVFVAFTFSSPPAVVAGSVYAIVITTTDTSGYYDVGSSGFSSYADGTFWYKIVGLQDWVQDVDVDLAFKTYVAGGPGGAFVICVIRLGVQEQNGTIGWLPGYGYPGTPISECQNRTDVLGQDVLDRTIMIHQFILNFTSTG
jgi:hypothetical protein